MAQLLKGGDGYGAQIKVLGLRELSKALQSVDPALKRQMDKKIRNVAVTLQSAAAMRINRRTGASAAGYMVKRGGKGTVFGYRVINTTRGGMITESAGSKSNGNPGPIKVRSGQYAGTMRKGSGPALISTLNREYGRSRVVGSGSTSTRILAGAWDDFSGWAEQEVADAVADAERELQAMFDAIGGGA